MSGLKNSLQNCLINKIIDLLYGGRYFYANERGNSKISPANWFRWAA